MSKFLKVLQQEKCAIAGITVGAAVVAGIGIVAYRKVKSLVNRSPRLMCCDCLTDGEIDDLVEQIEYFSGVYDDFDDWGEYENE